MKKTKFLAIIMTLALMLTGVGYAYWSDTITSETTVKTGKFEVNILKDSAVARVIDDQVVTMAEPKIKGKTVAFEINNMYPGAFFNTGFKIVNDGDIPAKIKNIDVEVTGDKLSPYLNVDSGLWSKDEKGNPKFIRLFTGTLADFESGLALNEEAKNLVLKPGEFVEIASMDNQDELQKGLYVTMDKKAPDNETERKKAKIKMTFNFTQFNDDGSLDK
ncbi:MAG: hypothetical protein N4A57_03275 [Anaeromicrobium sp.]|jgi:predicted ribosomally synthesized peptide with SipW-like signal peptide|uniref:hypothetical protein n=1 Tax=Anaeromicrobium sp. TaxID=1929132 RepID=UPI0025E29542|nr:hypothetical protein [Anaeromicrobium sp.]MCT4593281.1 hypothetical protein [Anaeromicrobium sp.]